MSRKPYCLILSAYLQLCELSWTIGFGGLCILGIGDVLGVKRQSLTRQALREDLPGWGILVLESHHAPDFFMEWRKHPFIKVVYALQGSGVLHIANESHEFSARDVMIVPAGVRNRIVDSAGQPSSLYVLCVDPKLFSFDPTVVWQVTTGRLTRSGYLANRVEALLRRLLFQQTHSGREASVAMAAATLDLFQILLLKRKPTRARNKPQNESIEEMVRYVEYLDSHFFEVHDIDSEARRMGISRRSFTKRFRQVTGKSWLHYVRTKAIDHATRLLIETSAPIASVAFECGFADLSTFYRKFKSQVGVTPAVWRNQR